jgi:hypothetical protein
MYIVLLNRQRTERHTTTAAISVGGDTASLSHAVSRSCSFELLPESHSAQVAPRGRTLVLASSEALLSAFLFFYHRDPAALIDWTLVQQAFNSCMILLLDATECRTITVGAMKAEQAFVVFKDLYENNVHRLARLAVDKISWGLQELRQAVTQPSDVLPRGQANAAMQGADQDEATQALCRIDTVMGHTGMFLLEDPDQQATAHEAVVLKARGDSRTSTHPKEQQWGPSYFHMTGQKEVLSSKENPESSQSAGFMQGLCRLNTLRSAPTQYATRSEDDNTQPHGYTAPTSPAEFSILYEHRMNTTNDHRGWQTPRGDGSTNPLHFYADLQSVVASGEPKNNMVWLHGWSLDRSDGNQAHGTPPSAWSDLRENLHGLPRQNSCPVVPPRNAQPPLSRTHYSSPSYNDITAAQPSRNTPLRTPSSGDYTLVHAPQYSSHDSGLSPYNHFIPRSAAPLPMSSIAEVPQGCLLTTQAMFHREQAQVGCPVVIHPSAMDSLSTFTALADSINLNDWSRYAGCEGFR